MLCIFMRKVSRKRKGEIMGKVASCEVCGQSEESMVDGIMSIKYRGLSDDFLMIKKLTCPICFSIGAIYFETMGYEEV